MDEKEFTEMAVSFLHECEDCFTCPLPLTDYLRLIPLDLLLHVWPNDYDVDGRPREGEPRPSAGVMILALEHVRQWSKTPPRLIEIEVETLCKVVDSFVLSCLLELLRRYGVLRFEVGGEERLEQSPSLKIHWNTMVADPFVPLLNGERGAFERLRALLEEVKPRLIAEGLVNRAELLQQRPRRTGRILNWSSPR